MVQSNIESRSRNHFWSGKTIYIKYSLSVSVNVPSFSGMQIASFLCRIKFSSVACLVVPHFPTLSPKRTIFRRKEILQISCASIFPTTSVWNISHSGKNSAIYFITLSRAIAVNLVIFNKTVIPSTEYRKILRYQFSWKSFNWEPSFSIRMDRRNEANSRLSQFLQRA